MSRKSKKRAAKRAAEAIPEEILAEGSGPNADPLVDADAQSLADAASEALSDAPVAEVEAEVEAVAMAAEVAVTAAESARAAAAAEPSPRAKKKRGRKAEPEVELDAWGQPILVDEAPPADLAAATASADDSLDSTADAADSLDSAPDAADSLEAVADHAPPDDDSPADGDDATADEPASDEIHADAADASETGDMPPGDDDELAAAEADGAVLPTSAAAMDATQLRHLVEALIFAADKPVTIQRLRQLTRVSDTRRIEQALGELAEEYKARGIALQVVSGGYQFRTNTHYSSYVQQLIAGRPVRLSRAQLETLAIVAYRQPITRPEIDEIRGVDSSSTLKVLLERALIRILGKREEAGRPTLYGTTKEFLDFFSLGDLRELPTLREYSELTAESRKVVSDRLGVSLDGEAAPAAPPADAAASPGELPADELQGMAGDELPVDDMAADALPTDDVQAVHADDVQAVHADSTESAPADEGHAVEAHAVEGHAVEAHAVEAHADNTDDTLIAAGADADAAADDDDGLLAADGDELADGDDLADDEAQRATDDAAALAAVQAVDSHATMAPAARLDPDDVAARATAGESDHHVDLATDPPSSEAAAADDALHAHDADSEAPDASASDDPPVD